MSVTIRRMAHRDLDGLVELWKEFMNDPNSLDRPIPTHAENTRRWREFVKKLIDEDSRQIQVAEQDGTLVGYAMCQKIVSTPLDIGYKWSYVSDFYVKPTHRRQGIGEGLLQATLEYLKSAGSEQIRLAVWHKNETAIKLYKKLGFRDHMQIMVHCK